MTKGNAVVTTSARTYVFNVSSDVERLQAFLAATSTLVAKRDIVTMLINKQRPPSLRTSELYCDDCVQTSATLLGAAP